MPFGNRISWPGVTVTITSIARQTADTVVTNESGLFVKERLLPGEYKVQAELAGFKMAVLPQVEVGVDRQTPVDFLLEIGQVSEEVTVSGGSTLLTTDRADVSTRFDARQISDLPVLDRNFTKFLLLTPGTQQLQWQHAASENPMRKRLAQQKRVIEAGIIPRNSVTWRRDMAEDALGMVETKGLIGSVEAADAMVKAQAQIDQFAASMASALSARPFRNPSATAPTCTRWPSQ